MFLISRIAQRCSTAPNNGAIKMLLTVQTRDSKQYPTLQNMSICTAMRLSGDDNFDKKLPQFQDVITK